MPRPLWVGACAAALGLATIACAPAESRNASSAADSVIGIVQCDDYLSRVDACLRDHVPAGERAAMAAEAHQMFATWKDAAADPLQRHTLPQACTITHDVARDDLARFGCRL